MQYKVYDKGNNLLATLNDKEQLLEYVAQVWPGCSLEESEIRVYDKDDNKVGVIEVAHW